MVRVDKRLHDWHEPVTPRPAATLLLLRDTPDGPEILMTRRSLRASFAPGAWVFPGGVVEREDQLAIRRGLTTSRGDQSDELLPFGVAALREAFEELGVLLAHGMADSQELARLIREMDRTHPDHFLDQLEDAGLRLALDQLFWLSHWVTDRDLPKRFDTCFFMARMPEHQRPEADRKEQFEPVWINPARGLELHEQGQFNIIFPTIRTLRRLAKFRDTEEILAHTQAQRKIVVSCPRAGWVGGQLQRFSEEEPPFGELELVSPDGRAEHHLDWQSERVVPLLRQVARLTAPNPGPMTGPGTNTYFIGAPGNWFVIDPGPADSGHIERILGHVGTGLKAIICTHGHPDHVPAAWTLQQETGAPVLGRASGPNFRREWTFRPDRQLEDGERLRTGDSTLRILHTPGHAEHHVCLLLEEDGLLFSGDHILCGSTTVISPPDGDMLAYIRSLERLAREPFEFILPAHGHVMSRGKDEVARLIAHRLLREEKVIAALLATGGGTLDDLVPLAYDDVDPIIYPIAKSSLLAHLLKLRDEGRAREARSQRWELIAGEHEGLHPTGP